LATVKAVGQFGAIVASAGAIVTDLHVSEPSLENLFLHHTGRSLRD